MAFQPNGYGTHEGTASPPRSLGPELRDETYLEPFVLAGVDTLVLGCTHYPVFKPLVRRVLRETFDRDDVTLVDSAEAVTAELADLLATHHLEAPERAGRRTFFCTDAPERFARVGGVFFPGADITAATNVDL